MKFAGQSLAPVILGMILVYSGLNTVLLIAGILGLLVALMTFGMKKRFDDKRPSC